jgi:hypothetical protein
VKTRTNRFILAGVAFVFVAAALPLILGQPKEPTGSYASYSIFPHDKSDTLTFSSGAVTWRTCCGDESWGTYQQCPNGQWFWTLRNGSKNPTTNTFIVEATAFRLTCTDTQQPSSSFSLRRRFLAKFPL